MDVNAETSGGLVWERPAGALVGAAGEGSVMVVTTPCKPVLGIFDWGLTRP